MKHLKEFTDPLNEMRISKKDPIKAEADKEKALDKLIASFGIATSTGSLHTWKDYLRYKKQNPRFYYPSLEDAIKDKKIELGLNF